MKLLAALSIFVSVFVSFPAFARSYNCSSEVDGEKLRAVVTVTDVSSNSDLWLGDKSIPSVGPCFEQERPGTRHLRCAHQSGDLRIEIYPWVQTTSGQIDSMEVVVWHGSSAQRGSFSCD